MADSLMDLGILAQQEQEVGKVDLDSGDCDDSSSGSDRSYEADDADSNGRGDSGSGGAQCNSNSIRSRRKRRHGSHGSRRHKGGSRHKHKCFQPYPPRDEIKLKRKSRELQEKENAAAVVRRDGANQQYTIFPVAPFNSTQYLMDEHSVASPAGLNKTPSSSKLSQFSPQNLALHSVPSTPADINHECINFERKDKEFTDIYTTVHAESLQSLPKEELVKHYISLEEKIAALQKKVAEAELMKLEDDVSTKAYEDDKDGACDSVCCSDTNSLSSSNEEFVDLNGVSQAPISLAENSVNKTCETKTDSVTMDDNSRGAS